MNHATRSSLAAVLTISVIALTGGVVFADAASDFETLFGAEAKKIAASGSKIDDAAFAAKLVKAAKDMPDSPKLQILIYEKATQFGSSGPAGCDTALEALGLLEKAVPDKIDQWRAKKFAVVKLRFDKSYGAARKAAGQPYMEMLEVLADAHVAEGKGSEAKKLYSRALMIAKYIRSSRSDEILAKSKRVSAEIAREAKLKSLQAKLKTNAQDTAARQELILFYVTALDNPAEAAKLLTDDLDEVTRTYVPLAAKKLDGLDEAICLELGDWYYRKLLKNASVIGKPVVLRRAQGYYRRFLESHTKKDAQSYRAKAALESIAKELEKLGASAAGRTLILNLGKGVTMKLMRIGAGKFLMGSPKSEKDRFEQEGPRHWVKISPGAPGFYMGVTEVTQKQYTAIMGTNPSNFKGAERPVELVSWEEAVQFCRKLSEKTKRKVRLPTEAEWEYACRAGSKTRFSFGNSDRDLGNHAWYSGNSDKQTHEVGKKKPNAWGLYDMHGNVWEWCADWYGESYYRSSPGTDPQGPGSGKLRVLRGGSWNDHPQYCRSAIRHSTPRIRGSGNGFRVVIASGGKPKPAQVQKKLDPLPKPKVGSSGKGLTLKLGQGVTMKLARIPAGKFMMGSPKTEAGREAHEGPQRQVTISKAFYIGVTEVTQAQYQCITGKNPSKHKGPRNPVQCVTWDAATAFCEALSKKTGRTVRLPTEAEWEYACRAGTKTRFSFGDEDKDFNDHGWCKANSGAKIHPVGRKKPNAWGLYDMHGNVFEWCRDWYDAKFYANAKNVDPENTTKTHTRVLRGGAWDIGPDRCRATSRFHLSPGLRYYAISGFRVVIESGEKPKPLPTPKVASSGKELTLNLGKGVTMKLASIPAGKFLMGSPATEKKRQKDEGPQRQVTIGKAFYMGVTEVTQAQYEAVTGKNPSRFRGPQNPAERISRKDAMAFCEALSKKTRRAVRLPTEAQWEYACRAGAKGRFSFGDDDKSLDAHGWCIANSDMKTHPVAGKKPNTWGLYDMHGNVWERCADWYADSYANAKAVDPKGPAAGKFDVLRGGSWYYKPNDCRAATRCRGNAGHRNGLDGFRVVVEPASGGK